MQKRTERNKELYVKVNKQIADRAKRSSNEPFKNTQDTLKNINPELFGNNEEKVENKEVQKKDHKYLIASIAFGVILVLIIIIAVVVANGK